MDNRVGLRTGVMPSFNLEVLEGSGVGMTANTEGIFAHNKTRGSTI